MDESEVFGIVRAMVCERELGIVLDKSEQMSNWGRGPLDADQLLYAAPLRPHRHFLPGDRLANTSAKASEQP